MGEHLPSMYKVVGLILYIKNYVINSNKTEKTILLCLDDLGEL